MCNVSNNSSTGQYSAELSSTVQHLSSTEQASRGVAKVHQIARTLVGRITLSADPGRQNFLSLHYIPSELDKTVHWLRIYSHSDVIAKCT